MRLLILFLVLAASCRQPTAPASDCPRPPADTATVGYNGIRIYLNACP